MVSQKLHVITDGSSYFDGRISFILIALGTVPCRCLFLDLWPWLIRHTSGIEELGKTVSWTLSLPAWGITGITWTLLWESCLYVSWTSCCGMWVTLHFIRVTCTVLRGVLKEQLLSCYWSYVYCWDPREEWHSCCVTVLKISPGYGKMFQEKTNYRNLEKIYGIFICIP